MPLQFSYNFSHSSILGWISLTHQKEGGETEEGGGRNGPQKSWEEVEIGGKSREGGEKVR